MADSFSLLKAKRTWREKRVVFQPNGRTKTMWVKRDHTGKVKTETPLQLVPLNPSTSVPVGPILREAVPESTPGITLNLFIYTWLDIKKSALNN